jgi:TolB protein
VPALTYLVDYEANWSPDGRQIVLISNRHGGLKVHLLNAESDRKGGDMRQVTFGKDEDDSPAWSPDGRKIAFVSIHGGVSDIFVMDANGRHRRQLTKGMGQNIHPTWSPDGRRILFNTTFFAVQGLPDDHSADEKRLIGEKRDESIDLASIRSDGLDLKRVTQGGGFTYASYSPDGKLILHRRQRNELSQIFVMNANGTGDHNVSGGFTIDGWPAWSPDGKRIVFSRHVSNGFQIFVMDADGSNVRQLTDAAGEFTNARWSPDGNRILCGHRLVGNNLVMFDAP